MTNCIKCHKILWIENYKFKSIKPKDDFVCICFGCVKKQNKNGLKIFN